MFRFYLITDTHLWATSRLGENNRLDQQCVTESEAIIDSAFDILGSKSDSDVILIAGDLTNSGENVNHEEMLKKLYTLKEKGKRVYVVTATHDYGLELLDDTGEVINYKPGNCPRRRELRTMYNDFGFSDAIAVDEFSMSYVVQLSDGVRLLALNDDGNGRSYCGYYSKQMEWIKAQIKSAKDDGQLIIGMTHHPLLPPNPVYPMASQRDMLGEYEKTAAALADAGLQFIFTGHSHCQNISTFTTPSGNTITDINTGSLVGYPAPIRRVTVDNGKLEIITEHVESFEWDLKGKTAQQYMADTFDRLITTIISSMGGDYDEFCSAVSGFGLSRDLLKKIEKPVSAIGRYINTVTFGKAGKILLCEKKIPQSVKNRRLFDFITEVVRNMWSGNEIYSPQTDEGLAMDILCKRLGILADPIIKKFGINMPLNDFVSTLLYDPTPDTDATFKIV